MNSTQGQEYQFIPVLISECKIDCVHDTECAQIEGFEVPHVCLHPTLLNKPLSTIVGVTENVLLKDSAPSHEHPSGAPLKFLVFLLAILLFLVVALYAYGFWSRYRRRKERGRTILKNESTGLQLDLITNQQPVNEPQNSV